ncbi:hypothetical protein DL98DRAFT_658686 [Cadophora sp. DSE1049]|nr:hypothetical protein DL98DRAFT_658686 [Cadophora sp. DSE1049]
MSFPVFSQMPRRPYPPLQSFSRDTLFLTENSDPNPILTPSSPAKSTPVNNPSGNTFTLFPLLPTELQLHIWTLFFTERRAIPIYSAPFTYTSRCALVRFLRPSFGPQHIEVPTKPSLCLRSAPYVCKASYEIYRRRYQSMMLMRSDRKMVSMKFNPRQDVVFFKMGLSSKMHTSLSLEAFVKFQPEAANCLRKIAVETIGEVKEFAPILKGFEMLEELVIVLPAVREVDGMWNLSDVAENENGWEQRAWELGLKIDRTTNVDELKRMVEGVVVREMERLKAEKWKDWKLSSVKVVEKWEDILEA